MPFLLVRLSCSCLGFEQLLGLTPCFTEKAWQHGTDTLRLSLKDLYCAVPSVLKSSRDVIFSHRANYSHSHSSDQAFLCRFCNLSQRWHISGWFGCGFGLTSFWPRVFQRVTGSSRLSWTSMALRLSALTDQCHVLLVFHDWPLACFLKLVLLSPRLLFHPPDSQGVPSGG